MGGQTHLYRHTDGQMHTHRQAGRQRRADTDTDRQTDIGAGRDTRQIYRLGQRQAQIGDRYRGRQRDKGNRKREKREREQICPCCTYKGPLISVLGAFPSHTSL